MHHRPLAVGGQFTVAAPKHGYLLAVSTTGTRIVGITVLNLHLPTALPQEQRRAICVEVVSAARVTTQSVRAIYGDLNVGL